MNDRIDLVGAFRRRWRVVVVAMLLGVIAGAAYSMTLGHEYVSTSRLYVSVQALSGASGDPLQNSQAAQQRLVSYASLATSTAVTDAVSQQMEMPASDLAGRITVSYPPGTVLLDIAASSTSPESAQQLTAAVDDALQRLVARIETPAGGGSPAATLSVVDPPTSGAVTGTSAGTIVGAGLVGGLVIGLMVLYARERFDHTVRTTDDLVAAVGIDVVDTAVTEREAGKATRSVHTGADNPLAIRSLRSQLQRGSTDRLVVLVTGVGAATGPVADQLARSFVDSAVDTILVRAHLPLDDATAQNMTPGLAEVLAGSAELTDAIVHTPGSYDVLPAGHLTDDAANLLSSDRCDEVIDRLAAERGCVVIDASQLVGSPETAAIARVSAAVVVVVGLETMTVDELRSQLSPLTEMSHGGEQQPRLIAITSRTPRSRRLGSLRGVVGAATGTVRGRTTRVTSERTAATDLGTDSYPVVAAPMESVNSADFAHTPSTATITSDEPVETTEPVETAESVTTAEPVETTESVELDESDHTSPTEGGGSSASATRRIGTGSSYRAPGAPVRRTFPRQVHAGTTPADQKRGTGMRQRWRGL
ncbi:Wzz/FepE/Etk N-terminal domain-containing protein [Williamsia phyllosphaerae]|uniref:Polysaccharide chain length determinant N-terminal domain-containing protein n=1 Tax=Williamsia phyllosphaerae TaxID=885042 RepID=A0ABQ1U9D5_9NOCA|nr:Wzz/FepE/Etk N-terminal domain-containing protein [Williamsia phyllosphaerae]GGF12878.1 hypothetical protein GCM10007298_05970 [Williamsia phyllosphaerae]